MKATAIALVCTFCSLGLSACTTLRSRGPADNPTPQVRIVSPSDSSVIQGPTIHIQIETKSFDFAYHKASTPGTMIRLPEKYATLPQEPNSGHVHVYLAEYPVTDDIRTTKFLMLKAFKMPNATDFVLEDVRPGKYRLLIELISHDHGPRVKHHPTDWPPLDMITVTVE